VEKHRYHGIVNAEIERPPAEAIAAFEGVDVAHVADAMGGYGVTHAAIKPITPGTRLLGPAVTVLTTPGDALYVAHGADFLEPGDVLVIDAGGGLDGCVIGERIGYYIQMRRRAAGVVVDGAIRDVKGLRTQGMPFFTRGITPRIFGARGPGAINVPVSCGGIPVQPGDLIFGDDDGVVVVPRDDIARVAALAQEHLAGELSRLERVKQGERLTDVQNLASRLAGWTQ
jgi:4-hydroxy-4-methyl-2-oxoglutarate aldolase